MITWWLKLGGNLSPEHDALLFSISGTGSFICPVAQTQQTYQGLYLASDGPLGEVKVLRHNADSNADLSVHSGTLQPPDYDDRPKLEDQLYPGFSKRGDLLPIWGIGCENSATTYRPSPGGHMLGDITSSVCKESHFLSTVAKATHYWPPPPPREHITTGVLPRFEISLY